jgi:hypothetical protein
MPTVTRRPRMQALPPMTDGLRVIRGQAIMVPNSSEPTTQYTRAFGSMYWISFDIV